MSYRKLRKYPKEKKSVMLIFWLKQHFFKYIFCLSLMIHNQKSIVSRNIKEERIEEWGLFKKGKREWRGV